jgi:hypothetical protein
MPKEAFVARKKPRQKVQNKRRNLSPIERILKKKADSFLKAEKSFWKYRYEIEKQHRNNAEALNLEVSFTIPDEISSVVWALKDGVAFVRYHSPGKTGVVDFRSMNMSLEQWGNEGLIVPTSKGEISLARARFMRGLGSVRLKDFTINDIHIPYVEITHAFYNQGQIPSPVERAIINFQLAFLGIQLREQKSVPAQTETSADTIKKLETISLKFEALLDNAESEEDLQIFLKENPMVLHPTAEVIPKKKLGEDFITDFVLVTPSDQGATYTLVELKKSSHPVLVKDYSLSSQTNHAIKQTRDWDIWIEKNKAYLQNKLPGFETPKYMVVIGRGISLDATAKTYLRSYNRDWKNIELLTYDDVLVRFNGVISSLGAATSS